MTTYEATYGKNDTFLNDADFYGRSPAVGVDFDACKRAAAREVYAGLLNIIHGDARRGSIKIRLACIRLAIALGNQSKAEAWLGLHSYTCEPNNGDEVKADAAQLAAGVDRQHAHPVLAAKLAKLKSQLDAA